MRRGENLLPTTHFPEGTRFRCNHLPNFSHHTPQSLKASTNQVRLAQPLPVLRRACVCACVCSLVVLLVCCVLKCACACVPKLFITMLLVRSKSYHAPPPPSAPQQLSRREDPSQTPASPPPLRAPPPAHLLPSEPVAAAPWSPPPKILGWQGEGRGAWNSWGVQQEFSRSQAKNSPVRGVRVLGP